MQLCSAHATYERHSLRHETCVCEKTYQVLLEFLSRPFPFRTFGLESLRKLVCYMKLEMIPITSYLGTDSLRLGTNYGPVMMPHDFYDSNHHNNVFICVCLKKTSEESGLHTYY